MRVKTHNMQCNYIASEIGLVDLKFRAKKHVLFEFYVCI